MMSARFNQAINTQIGNEFAAHQQYVACAVYYDGLTMPQTAQFFYDQANEERSHAMMMVQFILDTAGEVVIPGIAAPETTFDSIVDPVELALTQERQVTQQIFDLTKVAREENDYAAEQFLQWFIKEQVEEVALMSDLLAVVNRSSHDVEAIEEYVRRELSQELADPTAPAAAGA